MSGVAFTVPPLNTLAGRVDLALQRRLIGGGLLRGLRLLLLLRLELGVLLLQLREFTTHLQQLLSHLVELGLEFLRGGRGRRIVELLAERHGFPKVHGSHPAAWHGVECVTRENG
ncbi:hypothetical protein ACV229_31745 [Burkholderia sp. MR1-5-21]